LKNLYLAIGLFGIVFVLLGFYFFGGMPTGHAVSPIIEKYAFEELPDSFEIMVGEEFELDVDIGEEYIFSDDSELFDISSSTGIIRFTPEISGNYSVVIIALKGLDDIHPKLINFEVVE